MILPNVVGNKDNEIYAKREKVVKAARQAKPYGLRIVILESRHVGTKDLGVS